MSMKPLHRRLLLTYTPRLPAARGSAAPFPSPMMQHRMHCGQINLQLSLTPTLLHLPRPLSWAPWTVSMTTDLPYCNGAIVLQQRMNVCNSWNVRVQTASVLLCHVVAAQLLFHVVVSQLLWTCVCDCV